MNIKEKLNHFIDKKQTQNFIILLIIVNIISFTLETEKAICASCPGIFNAIEIFSVIVFTLEYIIRIYTARDKAKFVLSPMAIIDLLAILPFYLPYIGLDFRSLRVLRLFRILRLAKLQRYNSALLLLARVIKKQKEPLVISFTVMLSTLFFSSVLIYYAEGEIQPEHFDSLPKSLWWSVVTLTTVGYGDCFPVSAVGKTIAALFSLFGVAIIAIPTGIISAGFVDEIKSEK